MCIITCACKLNKFVCKLFLKRNMSASEKKVYEQYIYTSTMKKLVKAE